PAHAALLLGIVELFLPPAHQSVNPTVYLIVTLQFAAPAGFYPRLAQDVPGVGALAVRLVFLVFVIILGFVRGLSGSALAPPLERIVHALQRNERIDSPKSPDRGWALGGGAFGVLIHRECAG